MHRVRAVMLTDYVEVAGAVGLDGASLLREAGFAPEALVDPENRLPADAVIKLLERSAEMSGFESFGLLMAERRDFARLSPVSLLLERLPNLREVVMTCIAYRPYLNDVMTISFEESEGTTVVRLGLIPGFLSVQTNDLLVGLGYRLLHGASHGRWRPSGIHIMHSAPKDLSVWRRFFPTKADFGSDFYGLSCSTASMLEPLPLANETMAQNARRLLGMVKIDAEPRRVSDSVRVSIGQLLPHGRATLNQVAAHLGMSPRSIQRRLEEENETFGGLLNEVRRELATAFLGSSNQPVTTVAALLGYGSPSSFTRWFTATFGMTPQAWRANRAAEQASPPPTWRR